MPVNVQQKVEQYGVAGLDAEGGLLFEPRSLWSVGRFDTGVSSDKAQALKYERGLVQLPRQHFLNGARWPIVITRLSFAGINYTLMNNNDTTNPPSNVVYRNAADVLASANILLGVPRRQWYSERPIPIMSFARRPTATPLLDGTSLAYASSVWGATRLTFDKKLHLPEQAAIELYLGAPTAFRSALTGRTAFDTFISVEEEGGLLPGAARVTSFSLQALSTATPPVFPADAFGTSNGPSLQIYPPTQAMTQNVFTKQRPARAGSSAFRAISVHVDQISADNDLQTQNNIPSVHGMQVSPLALRIPTQARTRGGGTGTDWWRPGAPLGLVFTDLTPALVYDLPMPIVLNPGDGLNIQLQLPLEITIGQVDLTPIYQIGVAANGFAVIEG